MSIIMKSPCWFFLMPSPMPTISPAHGGCGAALEENEKLVNEAVTEERVPLNAAVAPPAVAERVEREGREGIDDAAMPDIELKMPAAMLLPPLALDLLAPACALVSATLKVCRPLLKSS